MIRSSIDKMDLFIKALVLSSLAIIKISAEDCTPRGDCECVFDNGAGYDLKETGDDDYLVGITNQNLTFYYHPCGNTKELPKFDNPSLVSNECSVGYSLCMYNKTENKLILLGSQADMHFRMDSDTMRVMYSKKTVGATKESSVSLECSPNSKTSVLFAPLDKIDQVNLYLFSKVACSKQIDEIHTRGFFANLFIVLLTLLFCYLFFGIILNYFFIGARGYELIPNYDFWCKVKRSAGLFLMYVKNGCRVIPADDSYDAI